MFPCCEMGVLVATLLLSGVANSAADGLYGKALVFLYDPKSYKKVTGYVTLTPQKPLELKAFTLCMKVATELTGVRDIILFAYRTGFQDEFNVWQLLNGSSAFYMSGAGVLFDIPPLNTFKTKMCITWESTTGLSAFWLDGKRSIRKIYKPGHAIQPNGTVLLGQNGNILYKSKERYKVDESFVGEIADVNMWDYVLPASQIKACGTHHVPKGNIFDWETIEYQIHGNVIVASAD